MTTSNKGIGGSPCRTPASPAPASHSSPTSTKAKTCSSDSLTTCSEARRRPSKWPITRGNPVEGATVKVNGADVTEPNAKAQAAFVVPTDDDELEIIVEHELGDALIEYDFGDEAPLVVPESVGQCDNQPEWQYY